ncbi:hypothetical protein PT974_00243 [Cladobotryum mycophilum]|uniref:Uncharacterized protein n=1 Tax=Cladobotryum mycophilum TaxID=491253 RepID=A0ABR0T0I6_9HYPO
MYSLDDYFRFLKPDRPTGLVFVDAPALETTLAVVAAQRFSMTASERRGLRTLKTFLAEDTRSFASRYHRFTVVSLHQALSVCSMSEEDRQRFKANSGRFLGNYTFMAACELPCYDRRAGIVHLGRLCVGCLYARYEEHGYKMPPVMRDNLMSDEGYIAHFIYCPRARFVWESSVYGSQRAPQLERLLRHNKRMPISEILNPA